jgi:hypothetical protein
MFIVVTFLVRAWFSEFGPATHSPPIGYRYSMPLFSSMSLDGHAKVPVLLVLV